MRFAIAAASDRYLGVFESFVNAGWQPVKLFTVGEKDKFDEQRAIISYAEKHGAAVQQTRLAENDLQALRDQGCEVLIVAGYLWKIPDWSAYLKYAVNFHPSPLPHGRGAYPAVRAILEKWDHWAVTCHKLTPAFDSGDILAVEKFPLEADECHERLDLKIQMASRRLAARVATQFTGLWDKAAPQKGDDYWDKPELWERVIDFNKPVEEIVRLTRAYGANVSLAKLDGNWFGVTRAVGWKEAHTFTPGSVVHLFNRSVVVAAADGYIGLLELNAAPETLAQQVQASVEARLKKAI
jgi:methionyl-tRNA formyltransferase